VAQGGPGVAQGGRKPGGGSGVAQGGPGVAQGGRKPGGGSGVAQGGPGVAQGSGSRAAARLASRGRRLRQWPEAAGRRYRCDPDNRHWRGNRAKR